MDYTDIVRLLISEFFIVAVIASAAKQSSISGCFSGLFRCAHNDEQRIFCNRGKFFFRTEPNLLCNIDKYTGKSVDLEDSIATALFKHRESTDRYDRGNLNRNIEQIIIIKNNKAIKLSRKQIKKYMFEYLSKLD